MMSAQSGGTAIPSSKLMTRFLTLVLITALGMSIIGCESQEGTTEYKTQTTRTQTEDGVVTGETETTTTDTTETTPAVTRDAGSTTTERTIETTTETNR
jgi:hypothetical protein